mmetsp:Transcript_2389/g.5368  ORF Transcript_2389/g.5368 Transcript_2389/m.5368 type:complete len:136 (-) Transcript_2389:126-533(-)
MVLISKKSRRVILEHVFQQGVICVKHDPLASRHNEPELAEIPNLHVMMVLRSLCSRNYVSEKFNWGWHYYFLTNEGIDYLRDVLNLPPQVFPSTLTKQRPTRPALAGADTVGASEGGGKGKGKWGKGYGKGKGDE